MARPYVEDTDLAVTLLVEAVGRVEDVPRREETVLDLGGALVARVITRRGPMVVVGGFKVVEAGCRFRLAAVFDGRSGSCETVADSWIAGSFLGRSCSSSPELVAFRFKLAMVGKDDDDDREEDGKEIAGGPMVTFSWSVCNLGKRDILTFAGLRRGTTPRLNPNRVLTWSCDPRDLLTCLHSPPCPRLPPHPSPSRTEKSSRYVVDKNLWILAESRRAGQGGLHESRRVSSELPRSVTGE